MTSVRGLMGTQRTAILAREGEVTRGIHAAHLRMRATVMPQFNRLTDQLQAARDRGETPNLSWLLREHRLSGTLDTIHTHVAAFGTTAQAMVERGQRLAAHAGAADAGDLLTAASAAPAELDADVARTFARVPVEALDTLVGRSTYTGQRLATLFDGFSGEAADRARSILYTAILNGDNPLDIAAQLANALNISWNRAATICRTEMMGAYRDASMLRFRANSDVCNGWQWMAAAGACVECADMDGSQHGLDEDFDGLHPNCRCCAAPLTISYSDILSAAGIDDAGGDGLSA